MKKNIILLFIATSLILFSILFFFILTRNKEANKNSGEVCPNNNCANNPVNNKEDLIRVFSPKTGEEINSPLEITGEARGGWYFEASFPILLFDANGKEIGQTVAQAEGDWMTENFVPFKAILKFTAPETESGYLILKKDNPSGLEENADEIKISINFKKELTDIKIFFGNTKFDPNTMNCEKVYPIERKVIKTRAIAKAAIEELLKGLTPEEKNNGYITLINPGAKLEKITIDNGVAKAEFNEELEKEVGGSCRVIAIRSQIEETLKQFPSVKKVIILINGRSEDILQP